MPSVPVLTVLKDSLFEIGAIAPGESLTPDLAAFVLSRCNQILDNWNAQQEASWCEEFLSFTFIPNQQDYTIGPTSADFTVTNRPVSIEGMNVVLDNVTPAVTNAIQMRDYQWWLNLTVREVTSTFATDCYYEPNWPNGVLHFWPKPTVAYGLELVVRKVIAQATAYDNFNFPDGYQSALMLTLAEDISTPLGRAVQPSTVKKGLEARARIYANNRVTPYLSTQDAGMPSAGRNRCSFNYRTGLDINVNR
jgi:hypothetical protein